MHQRRWRMKKLLAKMENEEITCPTPHVGTTKRKGE
jgi:hypothetical protein